MKWLQAILAIITCFYFTSCATHALWNATDPHEYVAVPQNQVNVEELKAKGILYYADPKHGVVYVEKTAIQKNKDYLIRAFATPVTVVLDAAPALVVVGGVIWLGVHDPQLLLNALQPKSSGRSSAGSSITPSSPYFRSYKGQEESDSLQRSLESDPSLHIPH